MSRKVRPARRNSGDKSRPAFCACAQQSRVISPAQFGMALNRFADGVRSRKAVPVQQPTEFASIAKKPGRLGKMTALPGGELRIDTLRALTDTLAPMRAHFCTAGKIRLAVRNLGAHGLTRDRISRERMAQTSTKPPISTAPSATPRSRPAASPTPSPMPRRMFTARRARALLTWPTPRKPPHARPSARLKPQSATPSRRSPIRPRRLRSVSVGCLAGCTGRYKSCKATCE